MAIYSKLLEGLNNGDEMFVKVFTVNHKGRVNNRVDLPVVSAIPSAFPAEPTGYELIDTYTAATTFTAPEDGYFRIELFGASGDGGIGAGNKSVGGYYGKLGVAGGAGGSATGGNHANISGGKGGNGVADTSRGTLDNGERGVSGSGGSGGTSGYTGGNTGGAGGKGEVYGNSSENLTTKAASGGAAKAGFCKIYRGDTNIVAA